MTQNSKPTLPTSTKITKPPKQSWISKKNQDMLQKIDKWKGGLGR